MKRNGKSRERIKKVYTGCLVAMLVVIQTLPVRAAEEIHRFEDANIRKELKDIPGIYSSVLRTNAEKNAVPTTLNVVSRDVSEPYNNNLQNKEKLVKNSIINEENEELNGNVAQVARIVVGLGILLCIGMGEFLMFLLVKNQ